MAMSGASIWINDSGVPLDSATLRLELSLQIQVLGRELQFLFEFPMLYKQRNLPIVDGLDKPGFQVAALGRER